MVADFGVLSRVWTRFHEPRWVNFFAALRYAFASAMGWGLLFFPAAELTTVAGWVAHIASAGGLAVAALLSVGAVMNGVWWAERVGILIIGVAYLAQIPMLWMVFDTFSWHALITVSVLEACAGLGHRFALISWAYLDPTR